MGKSLNQLEYLMSIPLLTNNNNIEQYCTVNTLYAHLQSPQVTTVPNQTANQTHIRLPTIR